MSNFTDTLKKAGNKIKNTISKTADVVSSGVKKYTEKQTNAWDAVSKFITDKYATLGTSYGGALASGYVNRQQAEASRQQDLLSKSLEQHIKDPSISQKDKLKTFAMYTQTNPDVVSAVPQMNVSNKEVWGATAAVATDLMMLGNPLAKGVRLTSMLGQSGKLVKASQMAELSTLAAKAAPYTNAATIAKFGKPLGMAINATQKYGPAIGYDLLLGGTYGVSDALGKNKDFEDITKEGLIGAGVNAAIPIAFGLTLRGLNYATKATGRGLQGMSAKIRNAAEKYYLGTNFEQRAANARNVIDEVLAVYKPIEKTTKQKMAGAVVKTIDWFDDLPRKWLDAGLPIKKVSQSGYNQFRTGQDQATYLADKKKIELMENIFPKDSQSREAVLAKLSLLDDIDRVRLGNASTRGLNEQQLMDKMIELDSYLTDSGLSKGVQEAVDKYNELNVSLLQELVDNGRISASTLNHLMDTHPNYIPHAHVADVIDNIDNAVFSKSRNPYKAAIQTAEGSTREQVDPFTSMFNRLDKHYKSIGDNTLTDRIIQDGGADFIALNTADTVKERQAIVESFKQAKKEIKNLSAQLKQSRGYKKELSGKISAIQKEADDLTGYLEDKFNLAMSPAGEAIELSQKEFDSVGKRIIQLKDDVASLSDTKLKSVNDSINFLTDSLQQIYDKNKTNYQTMIEESQKLNFSPLKLQEMGMAPINRWVDGVRETWLVPQDVAVAVKSLDAKTASGFVKFMGGINNVAKQMITGLNLPFGVNNKTKDVQTAFITSESFIKEAQRRLNIPEGTMVKLGMTGDDLANLYGSSGGYGSSVFDDGRRTASKILKDMEKSGFAKFIDTANPAKAIERINRTLEQSTRFSVFKKALENGLPAEEAVMVARDATVDFAKMGSVMKEANQLIPFLNARVQGVSNLVRSATADQMGFSRKLYYSSVIPSVLLDKHNAQYKSYDNMNDNIRRNYWAFITGEHKVIDNDGREVMVPEIIVLGKKGEFQQLATVGIDEFLRRLRGEEPKKWDELLFEMTSSISPISSGGYNPQSWWTAPIAAMGPLAKMSVGLGTNVDPYTGLEIVPQSTQGGRAGLQSSRYTKDLLKSIGETINVSPAKIQYAIGSFGQVPMQILSAADVAQGVSKGEGIRNYGIDKSNFGNAASLPWVDAFLKTGQYVGSPAYRREIEKKQSIATDVESIRIENKKVADRYVDNAMRIENIDERKAWLKNNEGSLTPKQLEMAKAEYKSRKAVGVLKPGDNAEVVAEYVYNESLKMKENGSSDAEVIEYFNNLKDKGIITKESKKNIVGLRQYGKYIDGISNAPDVQTRNNTINASLVSMFEKGVDDKYIKLFLNKLINDGLITVETKPVIKAKYKELKEQYKK